MTRRRSFLRNTLLLLAALFGLVLGAENADAQEQGGSLRLRLLYQFVVELDADVSIDPNNVQQGSIYDAEDSLDAVEDYLTPIFEAELDTGGYGRFSLEYFEFRLDGAAQLIGALQYNQVNFQAGSILKSAYEFRTIALKGRFSIPIDDWINIDLIASGRYVRFFSSLEQLPGLRQRDRTETIIPAIGAGIDLYVLENTYAYASFETLQYKIDGKKTADYFFLKADSRVFLRDWRAGLRYEIADWIAVAGEYRSLTLRVKKRRSRYRQKFDGIAVGVEFKI